MAVGHTASPAPLAAAAGEGFEIVLEPVSHPELGTIRIDENLFAVGRNEPPFDAYPPELVADLSRRHARIFCERGAVHVADLDSKNGTTVNGVSLRRKTGRLHDGDEIRFGGALCYRVRVGERIATAPPAARLASLTLTPERDDLGLQPIVITRFPFLVGKADPAFARYKDSYPQQVNYLSRRHAHIFLKGGIPCVEDLGSTNGSFVDGQRLDEHAVPLREGALLGFGGHHFVYRVSLQLEQLAPDPTVTRLGPGLLRPAPAEGAPDKTTFVGSADSFLDIFCVEHAPRDDEKNEEVAPDAPEGPKARRPRARGRMRVVLAEMAQAFGGGAHERGARRFGIWLLAALLLAAAAGAGLYLRGSDEATIRALLARGEYVQAARAADRYLASHPDDSKVRALATEALLKSTVPRWLDALQSHDFGRARAVLADMRHAAARDPDVAPLVDELAWMGELETFVLGRGGPEAPIAVYADEDRIAALLRQWNRDPREHQNQLAAIGAAVPAFRDRYAEALSHLRKLQSDDAVYLPAIGRLKRAIDNGLDGDHPQALNAVLDDYARKYPRIGGLDRVRGDLRRYTELLQAVQARRLGTLAALLAQASFATPPFQARFAALQAGPLLPPADVLADYRQVAQAWSNGDGAAALAGLKRMEHGAWADAVTDEERRKGAVLEQFDALQKQRSDAGFEQRLLAFYGALDPVQDAYFMHATEPDIARHREHALAGAGEQLRQAQVQWEQYRKDGAIDGNLRLEGTVSKRFRLQAQRLADATSSAHRGNDVYRQLRLRQPAQWQTLERKLGTELAAQRKALQDLRDVLAPPLLKAKLALLGGDSADDADTGGETR